MKQNRVVVDTDKCIGCGQCAKVCPAHNLVINEKKAEILLEDCLMCGQCSAVCPKSAVTVGGYGDSQIEKRGEHRLKPEEVLDVIRFRRTVRQFQKKEIPQEVLGQILEAGRLTHTAKNMQDVSFVVLDAQRNHIEQMAVRLFRKIKPAADLFSPMARNNQIDEHFFFHEAPVAVVILAKDKTNGILAAQNMEFVAEANGLGVLFSGYFTTAANTSRKIRKAMQIPRGKRAAATLVLGYPAVKYLRSAERRKLDVRYM